jgi:hypothetical protein
MEIKDLKDLKDKVATPGDAAAAGLGYALGYAADVFLFPLGVPPGTVAAVSSVGTWGVKKAVDAFRAWRKRKKDDRDSETDDKNLKRKIGELQDVLKRRLNRTNIKKEESDFLKDLRTTLQQRVELWEDKLMEDDELEETISEIKRDIRDYALQRAEFFEPSSHA